MPLHLPESYWNDVNRYYGEILAGAEVRQSSLLGEIETVKEAKWEAETPNTTAALNQSTIYYLGGLLRVGTTHTLSLKEPTPGTDTMIEYSINFHPHKEKIRSIDNGLEFKAPTLTEDKTSLRAVAGDWKNFFSYLGKYKKGRKEMKSHGLHLPEQEDYDRLHSELKRGASGAYTI